MFSLPRDTVDVPIPAGPARSVFGSAYSGKVNSWFAAIRNRADLFPGTKTHARLQRPQGDDRRALRPRHQVLRRGQFRRLHEGRRRARRRDHQRPGPRSWTTTTRASPAGSSASTSRAASSTWTAPQALRYARSRHSSNDFDRGQRQQRLLLSLREQADPQVLIPHLTDLVGRAQAAVRTDIPVSQLDELLGLASSVDTKDIRSYVFAPPLYQTEFATSSRGYIIVPNVTKIRAAVKNAFKTDPADEALREKLAKEGAGVWVLSGERPRPAGRPRGLPGVRRAGRVGAAPERPGECPRGHEDRGLQRGRGQVSRTRSPTSNRASR